MTSRIFLIFFDTPPNLLFSHKLYDIIPLRRDVIYIENQSLEELNELSFHCTILIVLVIIFDDRAKATQLL